MIFIFFPVFSAFLNQASAITNERYQLQNELIRKKYPAWQTFSPIPAIEKKAGDYTTS